MPNNGVKLKFTDLRDFDFFKSAPAFDTNLLPRRYSADAGLTMPDQNAEGLPYGCTGETGTDLCTDEDGIVYDARDLFFNTPPGSPFQGRELRESLKTLITRGPREKSGAFGPKRYAYFSIRPTGGRDWFDSLRVALFLTRDEKRSASIGIPWFNEFKTVKEDGILPMPLAFKWAGVLGHNPKCAGWTDVNTKGQPIRGGELFLMIKPWLGNKFGDGGWTYMSRPLVNGVMDMYYTEAFTVTKIPVSAPQTIELPFVETVVSFVSNLFGQMKNQRVI